MSENNTNAPGQPTPWNGQPAKKKKKKWPWVVAAILVIGAFAAAGGGGDEESTDVNQAATTVEETESAAEKALREAEETAAAEAEAERIAQEQAEAEAEAEAAAKAEAEAEAKAEKEAEAAAEAENKKRTIAVDSPTLLAEYDANEAAADGKYKGKILEVTGPVEKVDTEFFDKDQYVIQLSDGSEFSFIYVNCNDVSAEQAAKVPAGGTVTVRGEFTDGGDLGIELAECQVL
ncbi:OB-fold protein [Arthrobacter crystallopoietes]|uniref:OB-fold protein n=1 Tax=Crystallibacter crystallopoietes TaxID=37928 RepID=UPI0011112C9D|nr:hypothetical protein [Arthrobacter crystallopoietes]